MGALGEEPEASWCWDSRRWGPGLLRFCELCLGDEHGGVAEIRNGEPGTVHDGQGPDHAGAHLEGVLHPYLVLLPLFWSRRLMDSTGTLMG